MSGSGSTGTSERGEAHVASVVEAVERELLSRRDPDRAAPMAAYMRDQFPFLGVAAPGQKDAARAAFAGLRPPDEDELAGIARALWARDEREYQYVACGYLNRHAPRCSPAFVHVLEELIINKSWWDTVDSLAQRAVGGLVQHHPRLAGTMDRWLERDDIWLVRAAILHQNRFRQRTDRERLFAACLARGRDDEFFIRKAIGWALREYSKSAPEAVAQFVSDHAAELSKLSRTEAMRWIVGQEDR